LRPFSPLPLLESRVRVWSDFGQEPEADDQPGETGSPEEAGESAGADEASEGGADGGEEGAAV
jgi:hypothetical protein